MEVLVSYLPMYRLAGLIKVITAVASWGTVLALFQVAPRALAMRMPQELEHEIEARKEAETELKLAKEELEQRVQERTQELMKVNAALRAEIAERQRAEESLRDNREQLQAIVDGVNSIIFVKDLQGRYLTVNRLYETLHHQNRDQVRGKTDFELFPREAAERFRAVDSKVLEERRGMEVEETVPRNGAIRTVATHKFLLFNASGEPYALCGVATDITERKQREEAILALNERLRRSMRETHHRVKNNLQIVAALVNMQTMKHATNVPVAELERLIQHIHSLATIHDLLTQQEKSENEVSDLSIKITMERLLPMLQSMVTQRPIRMNVQDIYLPVRHITTVTVLVNELVSNAIKHGKGTIDLCLAVNESTVVLEVRDEGPGFPEGFDVATASNTGLELVESLVRWDLHGEVTYRNRDGSGGRIVIQFPIPIMVKTPGEQ